MQDDDDNDDVGGVKEWADGREHVCFASANCPAGCTYHNGYQHWDLCHQHTGRNDTGW